MKTVAPALGLMLLLACSSPPAWRGLDPAARVEPAITKDAAGGSDAGTEDETSDGKGPGTSRVDCVRDDDYPDKLDVPEASAAAEIEWGGARQILVVGDSKNKGAALLVWTAAGASSKEKITLPLDSSVGDDVEGMAWHDGAVWVLTSAGAVMRFLPKGSSLERSGSAYRIGPAPYSCSDLDDHNCGKNWEGLCLRPTKTTAKCAGYAASKADSALHCVVITDGKLAIDPGVTPLELDLPSEALSDCAFGPSRLVVTTNDKGGSKSYSVDEATGKLTELSVKGLGSNEAIAIGEDGSFYQFEDASSKTSPSAHDKCTGL